MCLTDADCLGASSSDGGCPLCVDPTSNPLTGIVPGSGSRGICRSGCRSFDSSNERGCCILGITDENRFFTCGATCGSRICFQDLGLQWQTAAENDQVCQRDSNPSFIFNLDCPNGCSAPLAGASFVTYDAITVPIPTIVEMAETLLEDAFLDPGAPEALALTQTPSSA
jgi:hypothetical protein